MKNKNKIILDLCGGTGAWSEPYRKAGYDVRLVTWPVNDVLNYRPPDQVYGILAAPPCTEFSLAKGSRPRNFQEGMKTVAACMRIIWECRCRNNLAFWALENPTGFLRQFLGRPAYTFFQWEYGELQIKRTDIWGYFGKPRPTIKNRPEKEMKIRYPSGKTNSRFWSKPVCPARYRHLILTRADIRAITPPGFAAAFFRANK